MPRLIEERGTYSQSRAGRDPMKLRSRRLSVSDDGIGMPPEVRARAFEPFFTTKEVGKGSGLGLAQVYGFANQSGGRVEIDSAVGVGTTVTLLLPRSLKNPSRPVEPARDRGARAASGRSRGASVLLVEDDAKVAGLTMALLDSIDMRVAHVPNVSAALTALSNGLQIDIAFSDVMMPAARAVWTFLPRSNNPAPAANCAHHWLRRDCCWCQACRYPRLIETLPDRSACGCPRRCAQQSQMT
jgi:hypothetical protein